MYPIAGNRVATYIAFWCTPQSKVNVATITFRSNLCRMKCGLAFQLLK